MLKNDKSDRKCELPAHHLAISQKNDKHLATTLQPLDGSLAHIWLPLLCFLRKDQNDEGEMGDGRPEIIKVYCYHLH